MRRQGSPQTLERVRREAISLGRQGVSVPQIAAALDRHVHTVYRWLAMARDQGLDGLASQRHPGAAQKLSDGERDLLIDQLLRGAQAHGFSTDLWTAPRVQRLIREQFGVEYHVNYIPTFLKTLGFTPQKPECRARERNEAEITHWLACAWPRVKKKRAAAAR
jgi:transposase